MIEATGSQETKGTSGVYVGLFVAGLFLGGIQLWSMEAAVFRHGGGIQLASEIGMPWILIFALGVNLWKTARRNDLDAKAAGFMMMMLGLLVTSVYGALMDFGSLAR